MIAMTWKAFNHTYMRRSDAHSGVILCPAYACKHPLHMCDRRLRQDAVSEIEDEGPLGKCLEYVVHRAMERSADATRKSNHLRARYMAAYFCDDALGGADTPATEFVRRQNAGPGIENLHRISACLQLPDQITGGCID